MFGKFLLFLLLIICVNGTEIDINKLVIEAKKQNKFIMFFHHVPGCPYCQAMLDENFKDENILQILNKDFIYVDIYTADKDTIVFKDFSGNHKEFSQYIGAFAYPATVFMNKEGKVIHIAIGYRNIDEHITDITYISTKSYETMNFQTYKEKRDFEKE